MWTLHIQELHNTVSVYILGPTNGSEQMGPASHDGQHVCMQAERENVQAGAWASVSGCAIARQRVRVCRGGPVVRGGRARQVGRKEDLDVANNGTN